MGDLEHVGDIAVGLELPRACGNEDRFPFLRWAARERFEYPSRAKGMLCQAGSAAEAYFIRELFTYEDTWCDSEGAAHVDDLTVNVQVPCGYYRIDATAEQEGWQLAIEIDGFEFHHRTQDQVAADYVRERRIVRAGYIVARFTAKEAIAKPQQCWREVFDILRAWCASPKRRSA